MIENIICTNRIKHRTFEHVERCSNAKRNADLLNKFFGVSMNRHLHVYTHIYIETPIGIPNR